MPSGPRRSRAAPLKGGEEKFDPDCRAVSTAPRGRIRSHHLLLWWPLLSSRSAKAIEFPQLKGITFAQWALESGRGTSALARQHLNFAGMKWRWYMSGVATKVWYEAHDGGEFYCKFATLEDFIAGYWLRLDRNEAYNGWRRKVGSPEGFFNFIADIWAPPSGNPNYKPKVLAIYTAEYKDAFPPPPPPPPAATDAPAGFVVSDEDVWVDRTPEMQALRRNAESPKPRSEGPGGSRKWRGRRTRCRATTPIWATACR